MLDGIGVGGRTRRLWSMLLVQRLGFRFDDACCIKDDKMGTHSMCVVRDSG